MDRVGRAALSSVNGLCRPLDEVSVTKLRWSCRGENRRLPPRRSSCSTFQISPRSAKNVELHIFCRTGVDVATYRFIEYFENEVLRKRPYIRKEWCIRAVENAIRSERQEHNRYRFWVEIAELDGRYLTVV